MKITITAQVESPDPRDAMTVQEISEDIIRSVKKQIALMAGEPGSVRVRWRKESEGEAGAEME